MIYLDLMYVHTRTRPTCPVVRERFLRLGKGNLKDTRSPKKKTIIMIALEIGDNLPCV